MTYTTILVDEEASIQTITLNRPERRNAMTPEMQLELTDALEEASASSCRVVVFRGAGDAFCSGLDLAALKSMHDKSADDHRADAGCCSMRRPRNFWSRKFPHALPISGPTGRPESSPFGSTGTDERS